MANPELERKSFVLLVRKVRILSPTKARLLWLKQEFYQDYFMPYIKQLGATEVACQIHNSSYKSLFLLSGTKTGF